MKVLMNNKNGVKILTGGKKCLDDIEVVPTFNKTFEVTVTGNTMSFADGVAFYYTKNGEKQCLHIPTNEGGEDFSQVLKVDANTILIVNEGPNWDDTEHWVNEVDTPQASFDRIVQHTESYYCPFAYFIDKDGSIDIRGI